MRRAIRIGLIAEGEAELGASVPYITPQEGGQPIDKEKEGALHVLIRRILTEAGLPDCVFIHRHPTTQEQTLRRLRGGVGILDRKYVAQSVIAWKPEEIDMVILVVDSDEDIDQRQRDLRRAIQIVQQNHLDDSEHPIDDRTIGTMAIKNFDTWLLADEKNVADHLSVILPNLPDDLESLPGDSKDKMCAKRILDAAIDRSSYETSHKHNKNRNLIVRWEVSQIANLSEISSRCQRGFSPFAQSLQVVISRVQTELL